jgi:aryl-alcohol dehydrogenase-like predicted oxidoreductase
MKYHLLGRSGLKVSRLCLGTMLFGEDLPRSTPANEAERILHRYLDVGGNHIDTANVYADGRSEEIIGGALKGYKRHQVVLATKVRFGRGPGPNDVGLSRCHILNEVEASLRRLQTDVIDLYYVHMWDPYTPIEETLRALDDLVTAGKVRYLGLSNFKAWQVMKALSVSDSHGWSRFVAAQLQYSLVVRDIEREFSDLCTSEGIGITPWGPLGGSFLTGKYRPDHRPASAAEGRLGWSPSDVEEAWDRRATERNWNTLAVVDEVVKAHPGSSYSQVALAWLLEQPAVSSVIFGARTYEQLEDNLKADELQLTLEEVNRLSTVSAPDPGYPYRMITNYSPR